MLLPNPGAPWEGCACSSEVLLNMRVVARRDATVWLTVAADFLGKLPHRPVNRQLRF